MVTRVLIIAAMIFSFTFHASARGMYPIVLAVATDTVTEKMNPINEKIEKAEQSDLRNEYGQDMKSAPWEKMKAHEHDQDKWGDWHHGPIDRHGTCHPFRRLFLIPAMVGLICLFIMIVVNVLLTVLVSLDMARRQQFNGLWIPILLLAGIPGTGLYALFRIGDIIKAKEQKI
jgi:Flp pilus assembly protein TadB